MATDGVLWFDTAAYVRRHVEEVKLADNKVLKPDIYLAAVPRNGPGGTEYFMGAYEETELKSILKSLDVESVRTDGLSEYARHSLLKNSKKVTTHELCMRSYENQQIYRELFDGELKSFENALKNEAVKPSPVSDSQASQPSQ